MVRPARALTRRCKSATRLTARSVSPRQGCSRRVGMESEGSRRQSPDPTNRNHIQGHDAWASLQHKTKPDCCPERMVVNVAGRWDVFNYLNDRIKENSGIYRWSVNAHLTQTVSAKRTSCITFTSLQTSNFELLYDSTSSPTLQCRLYS